MQPHPDVLYRAALDRQSQFLQEAEREHLARPVWPPAWRDPAIWSAIVGPIIGLGFLVHFARVILVAVGS